MVEHARKNKLWPLYLAFVLEVLFLFYKKGEFGFIISPLILVLSGLFLAIWPFFILKNAQAESLFYLNNQEIGTLHSKDKSIVWSVFIGITALLAWLISGYMRQFPIDIKHSDILPFIEEVFLKRTYASEPIYAEVDGYGYGKGTPSYLPFQWVFFLVSFGLNLDHRWVPFSIFILASALYTWQVLKMATELKHALFLTILPLFILFTIYFENTSDAMHTVEILVLGYYLFLGVSLFSNSVWVQSLGMLFPLLSRYAFVFWLPVHFINMVPKETKRFFGIGFALLFLVVLVMLPFIMQTPNMFNTFNNGYEKAALGEWSGQSWQQPGDKPFQLYRGLGFASWYYEFYAGTLAEKIGALKQSLFIVSGLAMLVLLAVYRLVEKYIPRSLYSLLALKISLTLFYAFMIIPYNYLNWVSIIISVVILSRV
ncbi:MAG: hypothetical protein MH472_13195, partial [Bacteroidia bacterium]|nr:hypothetical protein [Bacteroidia bacterium]